MDSKTKTPPCFRTTSGRDEKEGHERVQLDGAVAERPHPAWVDTAALLGTRPRACRPYRAKTKGKVERVNRELKEDFLAWLTGQVFPERPSLAWYDTAVRRWTTEVVATRRHRTTKRVVGEAWAEERGLLTPVSHRLLARIEGIDTLVPLPAPVGASRIPAALGETVEVRALAAYAELVR